MMATNGHANGRTVEVKPGGVKAVLYHGDDTYLARNRIVEKLDQRGIRVTRVQLAKRAVPLASVVDVETEAVLILEDEMVAASIASAKGIASASGIPAFVLRHNVSHPTWTALSTWVAARVVTAQPASTPKRPSAPLSAKLGDFVESVPTIPAPTPPRPATTAEKVAASISENEELTRLAMESETRARADLAASRREVEELKLQLDAARKTGGTMVRDQLAADLARKEAERAQAVRDKHDVEQRLVAQLEVEQGRVRNSERALAKAHDERDQLAQELRKVKGGKVALDPLAKKVLWLVEGWLDDTLDAETAKEALRRALRP